MTPDPLCLDAEALIAEAREKAGRVEFSDESFREPLGLLLDSLEREADLNEIGRGTQHARIVDSLTTRLVVDDYLQRHPEILEEDLGTPLVIMGLPRTGTTMLQRLIGAGPAFDVAFWWECRYPAPFAGSDWRNEDPRIPAAREEVRQILEAVPVLASVHPWDAEGADEEVILQEHTFLSAVPESSASVPGYAGWLEAQDHTPGYRYVAQLLQFLQWQKKQSGRGGEGRWVLKSPAHLAHVDALLRVFPGAQLIQTHRDPLETVPSAASMYRSLRELNTDHVDPVEVGRVVAHRYHWSLSRCMQARDRIGSAAFLDVDYRLVQKDPLAQVERIYAWLGMAFDAAAEAAMKTWLDQNSRDKRPPHRYTLAEFGYTEAGLAELFAGYRERHVT